MDRRFESDAIEDTVEYHEGQIDASDPEIEFRAHARGIDADQLLAGSVDTEAVGPRTDADTRQAADPNLVGHLAVSFTPRGDPAATPPSSATAEARGKILWNLGKPSKIRPTVSSRQNIPAV